MVKNIKILAVVMLLAGGLCFCACGRQGEDPVKPSAGDSQQGQPGGEETDSRTEWEKYM